MLSRFDFWKSTGGTTATAGCDGSVHSSSSKRIFQGSPGEQDADGNFYCGSKALNPGPGTYDVNVDHGRATTFGRSQRLMTASNMQFAKRSDLHVETRMVNNEERQKIIRATMGNKIYRCNSIKAKKKELGRVSAPEIEEYKNLRVQIKQLKAALKTAEQSTNKLGNAPAPTPVPFATHGPRSFNKSVKYDDSPTFYRSKADWDFGTESRGSTINMAAFQYQKKLQEDIDNESRSDSRVMTGVERARSRCRKTDFFGLNAGERSVSPNAFSHSPEVVPTSILKHHRGYNDAMSVASTTRTGLSKSWAAQHFSERQVATATRSSCKTSSSSKGAKLRFSGSYSGSDFMVDTDDMSEVSEITMHTPHSRQQPRFFDADYARRQYDKDVQSRNARKKGGATKKWLSGRLPDITSTVGSASGLRGNRFTVSTDDNFAATCERSTSSKKTRRKPTPLDTTRTDLLPPSPIKRSQGK